MLSEEEIGYLSLLKSDETDLEEVRGDILWEGLRTQVLGGTE